MAAFPDVTPVVTGFTTTFRNIASVPLSFGFLGKHGKRLNPGQQYTQKGDVRDLLATSRRKIDALERALHGFTDANGNAVAPTLAMLATPAVQLYDPVTDNVKVLKLTNGVLGIADPGWGAYHSTA